MGNAEDAAVLEVTLGGLALRADGPVTLALTGAPADLTVDGRGVGHHATVRVREGARIAVGRPPTGLRSYLAVRGSFDLAPTLGSRSHDVLSGLGPPPLAVGGRLLVGSSASGVPPATDLAPVPAPTAGDAVVRIVLGPRDDWFTAESLRRLTTDPWVVTDDADRVGIRLHGPGLARTGARAAAELPSEGIAHGSLQVASSGQPTVFLADHPVTGGYPVVAVVVAADTDLLAQVGPGQRLRFRRTPPPGTPGATSPPA